jgi:hypothetical protein
LKKIALALLKLITVVTICAVLDWFAGYGEGKNDGAMRDQWLINTPGNAAFRYGNLDNLNLCPTGGKAIRKYDLAVQHANEPANNNETMFVPDAKTRPK